MPAQRVQRRLVEHLRDQAHVLDDDDRLAVADRDTGRLLAPVLQRVQPVVGQLGDFLARGRDPEDAVCVPRPVTRFQLGGQAAIGLGHPASLLTGATDLPIRPAAEAAGSRTDPRAGRWPRSCRPRPRRPSRAARWPAGPSWPGRSPPRSAASPACAGGPRRTAQPRTAGPAPRPPVPGPVPPAGPADGSPPPAGPPGPAQPIHPAPAPRPPRTRDRKSTRLNS